MRGTKIAYDVEKWNVIAELLIGGCVLLKPRERSIGHELGKWLQMQVEGFIGRQAITLHMFEAAIVRTAEQEYERERNGTTQEVERLALVFGGRGTEAEEAAHTSAAMSEAGLGHLVSNGVPY